MNNLIVLSRGESCQLSTLSGGQTFQDDSGNVYLYHAAYPQNGFPDPSPGFYVSRISEQYAPLFIVQDMTVTPVQVLFSGQV